MADNPPTVDPDNVPEIFCEGKFNVNVAPISTLTFTHLRPKAGPMLDHGSIQLEAIIRARLLMPYANLVALRDLLNRVIKDERPATPPTPGATGHTVN